MIITHSPHLWLTLLFELWLNMATTKDLSVTNLFSLKDYVCLVTGGGTGIGLMATQVLAANGGSRILSSNFLADRIKKVPKYTSQADARKSSRTPRNSTPLILKFRLAKSSPSPPTSPQKTRSKSSPRRSQPRRIISPSSSLPPASPAHKALPTPVPPAT